MAQMSADDAGDNPKRLLTTDYADATDCEFGAYRGVHAWMEIEARVENAPKQSF